MRADWFLIFFFFKYSKLFSHDWYNQTLLKRTRAGDKTGRGSKKDPVSLFFSNCILNVLLSTYLQKCYKTRAEEGWGGKKKDKHLISIKVYRLNCNASSDCCGTDYNLLSGNLNMPEELVYLHLAFTYLLQCCNT